MCLSLSQNWEEVITLALCLWVFLCGYVRTVPKFNYAANVAGFSAAIVVFSTATDIRCDVVLYVRLRL